ncbi:transglutaminase family protein [Algoriphagus sediminis]|uniref:Transglutaminase family protein n=1 Tax=Algoriphagus sediminis TaxID=3057113 RepID=A0ABT7Y8C7_9BACT|nr:transglutaminase family protein [Algoriphagus sediminis]MDN3202779.1 transglutaminase family protein [Algoriphagus sediminis]
MLKLKISHLTEYQYDNKISLGLHDLFLIPQIQPNQRLIDWGLEMNPTPDSSSVRTDLFGNQYSQIWFKEPLDFLSIKNEIVLISSEFNPFNFLIDPEFEVEPKDDSLPAFQYSNEEKDYLNFFIRKEGGQVFESDLVEIFSGSSNLLDFLVKLTSSIYSCWKHQIRMEQDLWSPEFTYSKKEGSCRDLAWMQMHMLGSIGLATRFVSGYAFNPEIESGHELHAWIEVYIPGASWIGLDPSLGLLVGHNYVPLAHHPDPQKTLPVQGKFFGEGKSELFTEVKINEVKD